MDCQASPRPSCSSRIRQRAAASAAGSKASSSGSAPRATSRHSANPAASPSTCGDGQLVRGHRPLGLAATPGRTGRDALRLGTALPEAGALDEARRRARLAIVVTHLPGESEARTRAGELREEIALLVEARALDRQVPQDLLRAQAEIVGKQRVLGDAAREGVAVEPNHEERLEGPRPGLHHREELHAATAPADGLAAEALELASHQRREVRALERELLGQLLAQLADRRERAGVLGPAERIPGQSLQGHRVDLRVSGAAERAEPTEEIGSRSHRTTQTLRPDAGRFPFRLREIAAPRRR